MTTLVLLCQDISLSICATVTSVRCNHTLFSVEIEHQWTLFFHSYQSKLNFIAEGSSNILGPKYVEALHREWLQNWKKKIWISAFESTSYSHTPVVNKACSRYVCKKWFKPTINDLRFWWRSKLKK